MEAKWFAVTGMPEDTLGADGDFARDASARMDWGPKGRVTPGSWAGTAINVMGPTGPALLAGNGVPGSTYGGNGQGYFDAATGNTYVKREDTWRQIGNIRGPRGERGFDGNLGALAAGYGPAPGASNVASTPTPSPVPFGNGGQQRKFTPPFGSAFLGGYIRNNSASEATYTLVNTTTDEVVFTQKVAANGFARMGLFDVGLYPLPANNDYVWMVATATAQNVQVELWPIYAMPASGQTQQVSYYPPLVNGTSPNISPTIQTLCLPDSQATSLLGVPRTAGIYAVQATLTPADTAPTASTATLNLFSQPNAGGASTNIGSFRLTADGVTRPIIEPRLTDNSTFNTANRYFWQISSGATYAARVYVQVIGFV